MQIIRGKLPGAKKTVIYGPEGIGKSTFASRFPEPVFIDTEGSTKDMDVARLPKASSWVMLMEQVKYVKMHPEVCRTLVVDTADWAEMLCINHILGKNQKNSIEEFGYGKGYVYIQEEFGRFLNLLEEVVQAGIQVVLTAHAKMRKFEQPDELGAYDRWEMKLSRGVAPMVKEWADMVLFCNYKTLVVNVDGQGAQKGKNKAQGGKRVLYTTHHNCWDAKNRYGLPEEVSFEYESIRHIIEDKAVPQAQQKADELTPPTRQPAAAHLAAPAKETPPVPDIPDGTQEPPMPINPSEPAEEEFVPECESKRIPKELRDLMVANQVKEWDIMAVVGKRGYFPEDVRIEDYPEEFVMDCLVCAWPKVYGMIKDMKLGTENPFV